jgi:RHS repeat-associated protein
VRRIDPDGIIQAFAGGGSPPDGVGDGGPAPDADLGFANGIAIGPDDSVYVAAAGRVRRIDRTNVITTVAGDGDTGCDPLDPCGDGGAATVAKIFASGVAVAPDGTLFIAELSRRRVRRVGPDGTILTVAGTGAVPGPLTIGDGGPATAAVFEAPNDVALAADGTLFIADQVAHRIRRVGPDGIITTFAGTGAFGFDGDGGPATAADLASPQFVTVAADGSVFVADTLNNRIRRVTADGVDTTVAGDGDTADAVDGEPARAGSLDSPAGIAVAPDGTLVIADSSNAKVRRVSPTPPGANTTDLLVPSADGTLLFRFDTAGRHLATQNALTGGFLYQFGYDAGGRLVTVTDADGNVTTITRNGGGAPTAIVAPFGQTTGLTLDANGFLATVTDPAGGVATLTHGATGLLTKLRDPRNFEHEYTYDAAGRLIRDDQPGGGFQTFDRTVVGSGVEVEVTTALGRETVYAVSPVATGGTEETTTAPDGTQATALALPEGDVTRTGADGTITTAREGPDPRFQMQAPVPLAQSTATPGGLLADATSSRLVTLADPADPLSITALVDSQTINGKTATSAYDATTRTFTDTHPEGRIATTVTDHVGRVTRRQAAGLAPVIYGYDARGRLASVTQGEEPDARTTTLTYDDAGSLETVSDPVARVTTFEHDLAGRLSRKLLPGSRQIDYVYDASGNLTSIAPPGQPAHAFGYTEDDLQASYTPPDLGPGSEATTYEYNLDRQLITTTRPDGTEVVYGYDGAGRLATTTLGRGVVTYGYDAAGRLDTIAAPGGIGLAYDYDGPLLTSATASGAVAGTVTRAYDDDFRTVSIGVNGVPVTYAYDDDGFVTAAGALAVARDAEHGLVTGTAAGMVTDTRTHDAFGALAGYGASFGATPLYASSLTRDDLGRIVTKTETIGGTTTTWDYGYDLAGRLDEVQEDGDTTATFTYDDNGNRTARTGPTRTATYDVQDRILSYGTTVYGHGIAGERETRTAGAATTTYAYDELGNLLAVDLPGPGGLIEYLIDGNNRRVGRRVDGTLVQGFLYDNGVSPVAELDGGGTVVARFVYGLRANVPELIVKGGDTFRVVTDERGSPRLVVNVATGAIAQRLDYDEFGQVTMDSSPGFQPFGFAGGLYDTATGLVRFGARDYDAEIGRFTAKDLTLFGGRDANLYAYATGDPVNASDPTGTVAAAFIDTPTARATRSAENGTFTGPAPGPGARYAARPGRALTGGQRPDPGGARHRAPHHRGHRDLARPAVHPGRRRHRQAHQRRRDAHAARAGSRRARARAAARAGCRPDARPAGGPVPGARAAGRRRHLDRGSLAARSHPDRSRALLRRRAGARGPRSRCDTGAAHEGARAGHPRARVPGAGARAVALRALQRQRATFAHPSRFGGLGGVTGGRSRCSRGAAGSPGRSSRHRSSSRRSAGSCRWSRCGSSGCCTCRRG